MGCWHHGSSSDSPSMRVIARRHTPDQEMNMSEQNRSLFVNSPQDTNFHQGQCCRPRQCWKLLSTEGVPCECGQRGYSPKPALALSLCLVETATTRVKLESTDSLIACSILKKHIISVFGGDSREFVNAQNAIGAGYNQCRYRYA